MCKGGKGCSFLRALGGGTEQQSVLQGGSCRGPSPGLAELAPIFRKLTGCCSEDCDWRKPRKGVQWDLVGCFLGLVSVGVCGSDWCSVTNWLLRAPFTCLFCENILGLPFPFYGLFTSVGCVGKNNLWKMERLPRPIQSRLFPFVVMLRGY